MTALFISDLHLEPQRLPVVEAFLSFIQSEARNIDALYILGDFFEAWIGDDFENEFTEALKQALKSLTGRGISVYFMHGNRDFLVGSLFAEQTGCKLLEDPCLLDLYGTPTLLMHGDTLCTEDVAYQNFRAMVRDPQWQKALLDKSIAERLAIAQNLRDTSKQETGEKTSEIMDVTPAEVQKVMTEHRVQRLIHGHTHRPKVHQLQVNGSPAERIVLGNWDSSGWALRVDESGYELVEFGIGEG